MEGSPIARDVKKPMSIPQGLDRNADGVLEEIPADAGPKVGIADNTCAPDVTLGKDYFHGSQPKGGVKIFGGQNS